MIGCDWIILKSGDPGAWWSLVCRTRCQGKGKSFNGYGEDPKNEMKDRHWWLWVVRKVKGTDGKADFSMRPDRIQAETLSKIRLVSDQRLVKQHQIFCVYIDQYRSYIISDIWLVVWNMFYLSIENNHPNWRSPSFFRGVAQPNHQPDIVPYNHIYIIYHIWYSSIMFHIVPWNLYPYIT